MKWKTRGISALRGPAGAFVAVPAKADILNKLDPGKEYTIELKEVRKQRSLSANAYCWVLCNEISKVLSRESYISKEEVYQKTVRDAGMFNYILVKTVDADEIMRKWAHNGIGWQAVEAGQLGDNTTLLLYTGSSAYNSAEMSRLIDCLVDEARRLEIPILENEEIRSLIEDMEHEEKQIEVRKRQKEKE